MKGEYYADLDEETNMWCVFHTESSHAFASYVTRVEAERDATERNGSLLSATEIQSSS